jgi:hypothetical protein
MLSIPTTINTVQELRAAWAKLTPEQITELAESKLLSKLIGGEARVQFLGPTAEGTAEGQVLFYARKDKDSTYETVAAKPKRVLTVSKKAVRNFLYDIFMENIDVIIEEYEGIPPFEISAEEETVNEPSDADDSAN